jgi:hypothetical protein
MDNQDIQISRLDSAKPHKGNDEEIQITQLDCVQATNLKLQKATTRPQNLLGSHKNDTLGCSGGVATSLKQRACGM